MLNEQAVVAAWLRVRTLVTSNAPVGLEELRSLELALRPVAGVAEIQRALVPLLDAGGLHGLAMAWDSEPNVAGDDWLRARFERWLALRAPEFAFLTLAQLQGRGATQDNDRARCVGLLAMEQAARQPLWAANMAVLAEVDPDLHARLHHSPRLSLALRPPGSGLAEYSGVGGPPLQLWAATAAEANQEAERLCARCEGRVPWFIAGVGDGTLPAAAARSGAPPGAVQLIEAHLVRLRALLEILDLTAALRSRVITLHAGTDAVDSLADVLSQLPGLDEEAIVGGDPLALSLLESAVERLSTR
ncbi:MAG TPA: hypothetical protein VJV78_23165 [Polyangiales bacterium]|nr:hypothetical protein [Polyangiales bacterium]